MTRDRSPHEPDDSRAVDAFEEFLRQRRSGQAADFPSWAKDSPELAALVDGSDTVQCQTPPGADAGDASDHPTVAETPPFPATREEGAASRETVHEGDAGSCAPDEPDDISRLAAHFAPRARTLDHPRVEEQIGPYRIGRVLGEGGFGVVYLAEQRTPVRRKVALKLIKRGMDTRQVVARFEAERQALALMDHPSIAKVLDAGETDSGLPYFVMEHVPGASIKDFCDKHQLSTRQRLELFLDVCEAVQHAHQKGVIHRDLKPSNVLVMELDGRPHPKVIDFGIAKALHQRLSERTIVTEQGVMMGTPEYMSPEQTEIDSEDIDTRTDIYSLGVILYELLTGVLPFDTKELRKRGLAEIQRVIREEVPPKPSTRLTTIGSRQVPSTESGTTDSRSTAREVRGDLDWITMKSMEKNRRARYSSASELAADISRYLACEPVLAGPPSSAYRARKFLQRHRRRLLTIGTVLLVAAVVTIPAILWNEKRRDEMLALGVRETVARGDEAIGAYRGGEARLEELNRSLEAARAKTENWQPWHERRDEFELERTRRLHTIRQDELFARSVTAYSQAVQLAPEGTELHTDALAALETAWYERYREAEESGGITTSSELYRRLLESLELGSYDEELRGSMQLAIHSQPAGAEVWCFRYVEREGHLVPLPFDGNAGREDAAAGLLAAPHPVVELVVDPSLGPFEPGDRLLEVEGRSVRSQGDIAHALEQAVRGERFDVLLERGGEILSVGWTPWPLEVREDEPRTPNEALLTGRWIDPRAQFGFTLEPFPLRFDPAARLGVTDARLALDVLLPRGSYLLVLRHAELGDTRYPIAIPSAESRATIELVSNDGLPDGFVAITAGPLTPGRDREAFQPNESKTQRVESFALARYEVRVGEYLQFLQDPDVAGQIDATGHQRIIDETGKETRRLLVPQGRRRLLFERDADGTWQPSGDLRSLDWPVLGVTREAAEAYAAWKSERARDAGHDWRFRLPTDLEWERAARGADRRVFVWGPQFLWSSCWSLEGHLGKRTPAVVGRGAFDESVFGVRDLAGSAEELVDGNPNPAIWKNAGTVRGGSWDTADVYSYRAASRNSIWRSGSKVSIGFRLALDAPPTL